MIQRCKSWAVFGFGTSLLLVSLIPACGGSGGAGAAPGAGAVDSTTVTFSNGLSGMAATNVQAALDELDARLDALASSVTRVHQSTVSGVTVIPPNDPQFNIRTITFTPTSPLARILSITAEGAYDVVDVGTSQTDIILSVKDASGKVISDYDNSPSTAAGMTLDATGTGLSFRLFSRLTARNQSALVGHSGAYPSTSYTISVFADSGTGFIGQINSLRFSIETTEGVIVVPASPNITG